MAQREQPGLGDALRHLASNVIGALESRLELASLEVGEARERLVGSLLLGLAAIACFGSALVAASAWLVWALWDHIGAATLLWLALIDGAGGLGLLAWLRSRERRAPALFADTLGELRQDARAVRGESAPR